MNQNENLRLENQIKSSKIRNLNKKSQNKSLEIDINQNLFENFK